jgi:hypothetical protein
MAKDTQIKEVKVIEKEKMVDKPQKASNHTSSSFSSFRENVMGKIPVFFSRPKN